MESIFRNCKIYLALYNLAAWLFGLYARNKEIPFSQWLHDWIFLIPQYFFLYIFDVKSTRRRRFYLRLLYSVALLIFFSGIPSFYSAMFYPENGFMMRSLMIAMLLSCIVGCIASLLVLAVSSRFNNNYFKN